MSDLHQTLRRLLKRPGLAVASMLTLGVGIGVATAMFSVADPILLRPLDYPEPERVVQLLGYEVGEVPNPERAPIAFPNFYDIRASNTVFTAVAAYDEWEATLLDGDEAERLNAATVTAEFFDVLGVQPALGRFFRPDENTPGSARAVVLSYALWQRQFGGRQDVLGRVIQLNGVPLTVVGVAPAEFEDPSLSGPAWGTPALWRVTPPWFDPNEQPRGGQAFTAIARLRPGMTLAAAQTEVSAIMARLEARYSDVMPNRRMLVMRLADRILGSTRPAVAALLAGVGLLILIACANQAGLLLGRAEHQTRDFAVRRALGATRGDLVRLILGESVVLAVIGGAVGVAIAAWATDALHTLGGAELPRAARIAVNGRVLTFALGLTVLSGIVAGLVPALRSLRQDPNTVLKAGGRGGDGTPQLRLRRYLVATQVALSLALLAGAGLLLKSLWRLQRVDSGLQTAGVLTFQITPSASRYEERAAITTLYDQLTERLAALPGVEAVGSVSILPMGGSFNGMGFRLEDRPPPPPGEGPGAETRVGSPGFFTTFGVRVVRGRRFTADDDDAAPPVMVINRQLAQRYWPGGDPIGKRIAMLGRSWEIVGVVDDIHQFTLAEVPGPQIFLPHAQVQDGWMRRSGTLLLRTAGPPAALASAARAAVRAVDPTIPVSDVRPMSEVVATTAAPQRFRALLTLVFALAALALGATGVYAVVSYGVTRRTREFGIRLAVGATTRQLVATMVAGGMRPVLAGVALGLVAALGVGRAIAGLLFEVRPFDPITLAVTALVLLAIAAAAAYLPARRVARVDPMEALRYE